MLISFLLLLTHAAWHSVLAAFAPYGSLLEDYPIIQKIGHNLGLVSYAGIDPFMAVHFLSPEVRLSLDILYQNFKPQFIVIAYSS